MIEEKLQSLSSYTSKLLRQKFGRGPESCQIYMNELFVVVYVKGFVSVMEETLLQNGAADTVSSSRTIVIEGILNELKGIMQITLDLQIEGFYHDWSYENNSGIIVAVIRHDVTKLLEEAIVKPQIKDKLQSEVSRISAIVEKKPEQIEVFQITPKVFIVIRNGILILLEKALLTKGYEKVLRITKAEMEKTYFHHNGRFDEIFDQPIKDMFIDWHMRDDKSMICFILK